MIPPHMQGTPAPNRKQEKGDVKQKKPSRFWTEYYAAGFLLIMVVFLLAAYLVLNPLIVQYKTLSASVAGAATQLVDERAYLESLQRSIVAANAIPPETLEDVDEALPRNPDIPKLLQMIAMITQEQGVQLNGITFALSPGGGAVAGVDRVDMDINIVSSGYAQTRMLLDALEHNLRLFDIDSITLSAGSGSQDQSLRLRTYNLAQPAALSPEQIQLLPGSDGLIP